MKQSRLWLFALLSIIICSCSKNSAEIAPITLPDVDDGIRNVSVSIDSEYNGMTLSTSAGQLIIGEGSDELAFEANNAVQTFIVNDGENVYMMARTDISDGEEVQIDEKSTAMALVTMYPMFSSIGADDYDQVEQIIQSSSMYQPLCAEVSKVIQNKRNIFDGDNEELLVAFSNLIEDLFNEVDDTEYEDSLFHVDYNGLPSTRATYQTSRLDPVFIDADITRNVLTLRAIGLTPTYYGTATYASGEVAELKLKSRDDFGGLDMFTMTASNFAYGDPLVFTFNRKGECVFNFSRMTPAAQADFYLRLVNSILTTFGLNTSKEVMIELANSVARAMINAGSGVDDNVIEPMEWLGIGIEAVLEQFESSSTFLGLTYDEGFMIFARFIRGSLNWYNRIKGIGNTAVRLAYGLKAPREFSFCLCNYENELSTCTQASLDKYSGNGQKGYPNQRLMEPLKVYVTTIDENNFFTESSPYHRVKFEVTKGGGKVASELVSVDQNNLASVEWSLGESGEQQVRAVVVDIITGQEISEPVFFTATLDNAAVTVRLDWSQHSGNTDIDLHVVDPYGERIYFSHMTSSSGGYLDRDDRRGPGPEHIHWDEAPAGTYKIYVHYYPNGDRDRSVVSYKVSVTAEGKTYRPVTGAISYDEMKPVGQFTVGAGTRGVTLETTGAENFEVPTKK